MPEWLKIALLIPIYVVFAPTVGAVIRPYRPAQRVVFFLMLLFAMMPFRWISTSPGFPQEVFYRGHTRGFECTLMEVMAVILIFAGRGPAALRGPWLPPGLWIYLLYCFVAGLSIFNSVRPSFTLMAIAKFIKLSVVAVGAFHFFRTEKDVRFFLKCVVAVMILQASVCLYEKYVQHVYQVFAWFEHQNSMTMFTYMLGLPLLAATMAHSKDKRELNLYAGGYVAASICIITALSRAGMLAFMIGTAFVVLLSLRDQITKRRLMVVSVMGVIGLVGLIRVSDTLINRFHDAGNVQSGVTRDLLNESSRKMIHDHPFLGTGWNTYGIMINPPYSYGDNFDEHARKNGWKALVDYDKPISESWYYLVAAETGLPSLVILIAFLLTTLFWSGRLVFYYRKTLLGAVAIGLFTGLSLNYLQSTIERVLTQPKNITAWMICVALIARLEWWRRQEARGKQPVWLSAYVAPASNPGPAHVKLPIPGSVRPKQNITILPPHLV